MAEKTALISDMTVKLHHKLISYTPEMSIADPPRLMPDGSYEVTMSDDSVSFVTDYGHSIEPGATFDRCMQLFLTEIIFKWEQRKHNGQR